jgi:hypothetical protein
MKLRIAAAMATVAAAAMLAVPGAALAASSPSGTTGPSGPTSGSTVAPVSSLRNIPLTGKTGKGKTVTGTLSVSRFARQHGKLVAIGTVHINGKTRKNVAFPVRYGQSATTAVAACSILHLVLGPIDLNLLGLHVTTNQIVLNITAEPGAGNLLGNLLCDVANLLNGPSPLPPGPLANLLNGLLGFLNAFGL